MGAGAGAVKGAFMKKFFVILFSILLAISILFTLWRAVMVTLQIEVVGNTAYITSFGRTDVYDIGD